MLPGVAGFELGDKTKDNHDGQYCGLDGAVCGHWGAPFWKQPGPKAQIIQFTGWLDRGTVNTHLRGPGIRLACRT